MRSTSYSKHARLFMVMSGVLFAWATMQTLGTRQQSSLAQEPNRGGVIDLASQDPEVALKSFVLAEGYEINLFASEQDFPIGNPVAMNFDAKGRLWLSTMPTYPQYLPGVPPKDKIIILEDTNHDGKADKHTVFADGLHLPTGFELGDGGVYVGLQPDLAFLKDTDGDDVADEQEILIHGLGTEDSHHAVHAFQWDPGGQLYFAEGTFHNTQVETPYGAVRLKDAGIFRFEPKRHKLEVFVSYPFANPWGHIYDRWGQNFIADASGGSNYFGLPITGHVDFPRKHPQMKEFTSKVRPTCGCEIVSSRHFPDEAQGNFLINNCIGFQGIKQHQIIEEDSGFTSKEIEPLLYSTDPNFRPVAIQFGPDGALYIVDWFNPLIGHMQYSLRDENRDTKHGRVWRITAKGRPLVEKPQIDGQSISGLLELLKTYEDRTRYRARRELRLHDKATVAAEIAKWVAGLDQTHPDYEHHLLEALWSYQTIYHVEPELLNRLLNANNFRARAAATRVLRYWRDQLEDPLQLLQKQVNDLHPRVRLEAVVALSHFTSGQAAEIVLEALMHPMDYYLNYGLTETMATLEPYWKADLAAGKPFSINNPLGVDYVLQSVSTSDLTKVARSGPVYLALLTREGILPQYRQEAICALAQQNQWSETQELLTALNRLDQSQATSAEVVLNDLAHLLFQQTAEDLNAEQSKFQELSKTARRSITRQAAFIALLQAGAEVSGLWSQAAQNPGSLQDLIDAVALIPDRELRKAFYPYIEPLLHQKWPSELDINPEQSNGTAARFVRIELPGNNRTLTLAEVEVFSGGKNIASLGKASQSSTSNNGGASRAIDGNRSGRFADQGQTHTQENGVNPYWELDLGQESPIDQIVVWNRTEASLGNRLNGFELRLLDSQREVAFEQLGNSAPVESVAFNFQQNPKVAIRRSVIDAVVSIPGHEAETFKTLAKLISTEPDVRDAAIASISRIPRGYWPRESVRPLLQSLIEYVSAIPVKDRTAGAALAAIQLGNDLVTLLPPEEARTAQMALGDLGVAVVTVRPIPHEMAFDRTKIYVEAGKPVEIILENTDIMPHNLLITAPGAFAEVGQLAEQMAADPDAFAKQFIPDSPKVLYSTRMLQPRQSERLQFIAPQEPGQYPYVCTFPGHWRTMHGTLHVVNSLSEVPAEELLVNVPLTETRPFVRNWTLEDLTPLLDKITPEGDFSFTRGKELYRAASCASCHKMGSDGGIIGPDLTDSSTRFKLSELLSEIVEPSKVINENYRTQLIQTADGEIITGVITSRSEDAIQVVANVLELNKPRKILLDEIEQQRASSISIMPEGLLSTLTEEEILDLLVYIQAAGKYDHPLYQQNTP